jgi:hypothetical protein
MYVQNDNGDFQLHVDIINYTLLKHRYLVKLRSSAIGRQALPFSCHQLDEHADIFP